MLHLVATHAAGADAQRPVGILADFLLVEGVVAGAVGAQIAVGLVVELVVVAVLLDLKDHGAVFGDGLAVLDLCQSLIDGGAGLAVLRSQNRLGVLVVDDDLVAFLRQLARFAAGLHGRGDKAELKVLLRAGRDAVICGETGLVHIPLQISVSSGISDIVAAVSAVDQLPLVVYAAKRSAGLFRSHAKILAVEGNGNGLVGIALDRPDLAGACLGLHRVIGNGHADAGVVIAAVITRQRHVVRRNIEHIFAVGNNALDRLGIGCFAAGDVFLILRLFVELKAEGRFRQLARTCVKSGKFRRLGSGFFIGIYKILNIDLAVGSLHAVGRQIVGMVFLVAGGQIPRGAAGTGHVQVVDGLAAAVRAAGGTEGLVALLEGVGAVLVLRHRPDDRVHGVRSERVLRHGRRDRRQIVAREDRGAERHAVALVEGHDLVAVGKGLGLDVLVHEFIGLISKGRLSTVGHAVLCCLDREGGLGIHGHRRGVLNVLARGLVKNLRICGRAGERDGAADLQLAARCGDSGRSGDLFLRRLELIDRGQEHALICIRRIVHEARSIDIVQNPATRLVRAGNRCRLVSRNRDFPCIGALARIVQGFCRLRGNFLSVGSGQRPFVRLAAQRENLGAGSQIVNGRLNAGQELARHRACNKRLAVCFGSKDDLVARFQCGSVGDQRCLACLRFQRDRLHGQDRQHHDQSQQQRKKSAVHAFFHEYASFNFPSGSARDRRTIAAFSPSNAGRGLFPILGCTNNSIFWAKRKAKSFQIFVCSV